MLCHRRQSSVKRGGRRRWLLFAFCLLSCLVLASAVLAKAELAADASTTGETHSDTSAGVPLTGEPEASDGGTTAQTELRAPAHPATTGLAADAAAPVDGQVDEDEDDEAFVAALVDAIFRTGVQGGDESEEQLSDDTTAVISEEAEDVGGDSEADGPARRDWSAMRPPPLTWHQFVERLHAEHCLQMPAWWEDLASDGTAAKRHGPRHPVGTELHDDDDASRTRRHLQRFPTGSFCRRPVVVVNTWLTRGSPRGNAHVRGDATAETETTCSSCEFLLHDLLATASAELSLLFPTYATLVVVEDPIRDAVSSLPHIHFLPDIVPPAPAPQAHVRAVEEAARQRLRHLVQMQCDQAVRDRARSAVSGPGAGEADEQFQRVCAAQVSARVLERVASPLTSAFAAGSAAPDALVTATAWESWLHAALEAQGSYAVRTLFLYPHNGSVMRHIVNDDDTESDAAHAHFFPTAKTLLRGVKRAVWTMEQLVSNGQLVD